MENRNRVLVIGLDGATWNVLTPWIEDGSLPNLAALRAGGSWGELRSTLPPLTAPAWSSFLTGKNPGKHGVYHFIDLDDRPAQTGSRETTIVDSRSIQSATLWDILGHHDRRVGVINVPMSYPPRPVNGFMITCLLTPPGAPVFTYPPELSRELVDYQIDLDRFIDQKPFERDENGSKQKRLVEPSLQLVQEFHDMEEKRARTALSLMDSEAWDLFMVVFTATDRMGHYLWPYHRAEDLDGSPESMELHQAIHNLYKRLDDHIGALVEKAGPDASVVVMSDHGMGPIFTKNTQWNNWLYQKGYVRLEKKNAKTPDAWLLRLGIPRDRIRRMVQGIPGMASNALVKKAKHAPSATIDTAASTVYYVPIFNPVGGFRINAAGAERDAIREEIMAEVQKVIDPSTGKPVIRSVFRREEVYTGPYADQMPDIIFITYPEYGGSDRLSHYSSIVTDRPSISDPGGHHLEGIFIAHGPAVQAVPQPIDGLVIEDIAPTILYLMDLPVPSDIDGRVINELFSPQVLQEKPLIPGSSVEPWPSAEKARAEQARLLQESPPTAEEESLLRERLRALGYLEHEKGE